MKRPDLFLAKAALLLAAFPLLLYSYSEGPDAGVAGVPGESNCTACHGGSSGSGNVKVAFANGLTYSPGVKQHFTVTITDSAQRRWGFELTARQSNNKTQAGTFTPGPDGFTQLVCTQTTFQTESFGKTCPASMPMQYIEHTLGGTRNGTRSSVNFDFDWTPPATDVGPINIYVAANAANGDGGTGGDHIYTAHYTLTSAPLVTPPSISSIVNAAGGQGTIAASSWVTITGSNLSNTTKLWGSGDFVNGQLPGSLDGVKVTVNNKPAYINYVSPTQLNIITPGDTAVGPVAVVVTNNGVASAQSTIQMAAESPALFLWAGKYAVTTRADYSLVGPATLFPGSTTPAKPGDVVILWVNGLGTTTPSAPDGQLTPSTQLYYALNPANVTIGGTAATIYAEALAPGFADLYQIAIQIPPTVPDGDLPLVLQSGSFQSPSGVYITVQQ